MPTKPFYIRQKPPAQSFIQLPSFLFEVQVLRSGPTKRKFCMR